MIFLIALFMAITTPQQIDVDWILTQGLIYTVDSNFTIAEAMAIHDGKIVACGSTEQLLAKYKSEKMTNLNGKAVYPGFIDAHCHFLGYGKELSFANLNGTTSFEAVLEILQQHNSAATEGWIIGRGWDQNLWQNTAFPNCKLLDQLYPTTPVFLMRVDGHAALVNSAALKLAGITPSTKIEGGIIELDNEKCTGLLIDNAMTPFFDILPGKEPRFIENALLAAQKNCFAVGLTSIHEAGLDKSDILTMMKLQKAGQLKMRIHAMIATSDENLNYFFNQPKIKTPYLNVSSVKISADGALGSRGAALLNDYSDHLNNKGLLFYTDDSLKHLVEQCAKNNFQVCVHAIGDAANRQVLSIFGEVLKSKNDRRWRIEHCQVIHEADFDLFAQYSILASVQTTHATSDMNWADERLGEQRIENAYAYKKLLQQNGMLANGSDFPVESINPLFGFYAAVVRKNHQGLPENGFQMEQALTRIEALKAMTIWAAYAAFEEHEKGSLEAGKYADFVILDQDIMQMEAAQLFDAKVLITVSNGEIEYAF